MHTYIHCIDPCNCYKTTGCTTRHKHTDIYKMIQCAVL